LLDNLTDKMDKRVALVNLLENSLLIKDEIKKKLLEKIETMSDEDVDKLGKFLVLEREELLEDETGLTDEADKIIAGIK
jgi:hypothetical protein